MNKKSRFSDSELVESIKQKDLLERAVIQLYEEHAEITRSFIMGKGGTEQDADDIFQHLWYNEIRRRHRAGNREKLFETGREQEEDGISGVIQDRELKNELSRLLGELGESCKKILELFYYENLSMKEIVSHLHYENEQVVRNKKYKCLQQLTDKMKQNPLAAKQINELIQ
jgi:DNA-directed RNA polymerase specialized sigma24 family protein